MQSLRFLHIPKTAGSTFSQVLQRQYAGKKSFEFTGNLAADKTRFEALSDKDKEDIVLFTGHAPIVTGIEKVDNATTITFLRDPISRVKSYCQFVSEGKVPSLMDGAPFDLDRFLESGNAELSNFQTKALVRDGRFQSLKDTPALRDKALDNLFNRIWLYGLQEYFDESLMIFCSRLGWRMPLYSSVNTKNARKLLRFNKHQLARIADMNTIDMEVYRLAREKFIQVLNNAAFDKAKLKRFRLINRSAPFIIKAHDWVNNRVLR